MKIAAMTEGPDWNSPVAETFAAAEWLLIDRKSTRLNSSHRL